MVEPGTEPKENTGPPATEPVLSAAQLAELQALRQTAAEYEDVLARVGPERIRRFYENPEFGQFEDEAYASFQEARKRNTPTVSPDWDPKVNPRIKQLDENAQFIADLKKEREAQAKAESEKWLKDALAYADRIQVEDRPLYDALAKDDWGLMIHGYARSRGMSFEDAVKKFKHNFSIGAGRDIPTSLPPDAGAPGVPAESGEEQPAQFKTADERRAWMSKRIARAQKRSA